MALFATPDQVRAAEQQQRVGVGSNFNEMVSGSLFNLGHSLGNVGRRAAGDDTRSQAVKDAQNITRIVADVDFNDKDSVMAAANALNSGGYTQQAFDFLKAVPESVKPPKMVVDEFIREERVGNTTKRFLYQRDNYGYLHSVGTIQDTASAAEGLNLPSRVYDDVKVDNLQNKNIMARLMGREEFKGFFNDTDSVEAFEPLVGEVQRVANQLKSSHRDQLMELWMDGQITSAQIEASIRSDSDYVRDAYDTWVEGGGLDASVKKGFGFAGADVTPRGDVDTTDLGSLRASIERGNQRDAATAAIAERQGQLVFGDPAKNEFRIKGLDTDLAKLVFSGTMDDDEIQATLEESGYRFTPELLESHAERWQTIRENPTAAAIFLNYNDREGIAMRDARAALYLNELETHGNVDQWARASAIFKYLGGLEAQGKVKKGPHGRKKSR